jgi:electron transport complex, RnfABCDGE type, A subunit/electron transport complex, RnfABCDGE type, E subunit
MSIFKTFKNGIWKENPIFIQVIGMCPTLAVTTAAINGIAMGIAATFVLFFSNILISLLRKVTPDKIRIPIFIVVIATFTTMIGMLIKAFSPDLDKALGIYIPLIVVNCMIMARAEAFAYKNTVLQSAADGLGMGLGFTLALFILGSIREIIGNGSIFGISLFGPNYQPALIFIMPPGAFITLGLLLGFFRLLESVQKNRKEKSIKRRYCWEVHHMLTKLILILISSILVNNFVLVRFLGECPFLGVSKKIETALGMGIAVTFVMTIASAFAYIVYNMILVPLGLSYLETIAFILVIASLVQFVEMVIKKSSPALHQALGIYLPLITTNCAVLGVALLNVQENYNFIEAVVNGFGSAVGFTLAIVLYAGIRERLELAPISKVLEGFPIALIGAGLMSIAFLGFQGLI